ncbi:MAG: TetR/AcrR family transcriptional regulator [Myxococcales bacterium]|nr:TetR/AcrR family transcriptional regulator [Myxococcales bacterium]
MPTTKPTVGKRAAEKRKQIRLAAFHCFRVGGYHETTVDAICAQAAISKGSFYWHYPSKQDVFVDILETWTREVMDELYEQFEDAVLGDDYLSAVTAALGREIHRGRAIVPLWLEFTAHATRDPAIQQALAKFYRRARTAIAEILRPALENSCTESQIRGIAAVIFGAYSGLIIQDISDPERADATVSVREFMAVMGPAIGRVIE